jgi:hypothetical protein
MKLINEPSWLMLDYNCFFLSEINLRFDYLHLFGLPTADPSTVL